MKKAKSKDRILILGASGFLGGALYRELCHYYNTFGTFFTPTKELEKNRHFFHYDLEHDDLIEIIKAVKPSIIISALRGEFSSQIIAHSHLAEYARLHKTRVIFLSSANVFDAYSKYPSYEFDTTLSNSVYGHLKIKIENMLIKRLSKKQVTILRMPMVFGGTSPRLQEIRTSLKEKTPIEIFPNLIMNVTNESRVTQQVHYIINRKKYGIYHLGSKDLVHHDDFIKEIVTTLNHHKPIFKHVYTTNDDRYLAVLPKENKLPKHLQLYSQEIIEELEI